MRRARGPRLRLRLSEKDNAQAMSDSIRLFTVEDAGYRKLCPREFPRASNLKTALELGGYEVLEGDDFLYCKPLSPDTTLIALEATLSKDNFSEWNKILASLNFLYNPQIPPEVPQIIVSDTDIEKRLGQFSEDPVPRSLYELTSLLFWPPPARMPNVLKNAVPRFFDKYPNGRLHFVRLDSKLAGMQSVSRVLTAIDAFGFEVSENPEIREQHPSELLSRIHPGTFEPVSESSIKTLLSCFFRYIYGSCVPRLGGMIIVQIDPPCEFELPQMRDRWNFSRLTGMFESGGLGLDQYLKTKTMITPDQERIAYKRYVFRPAWTAQEFEDLLKWTIGGINKFLTFTVDLCNYTNQAGYIDFIKQRKIVLTLERIIAEINYIVTEMDPFVRKTFYFNLHDKIATLPNPRVSLSERRPIFNRLFKHTHYSRVLRKRLSSLPEPFDTKISLLGDALFEDLIDRCVDSIWARYRVSEKTVRVRETSSTTNGYISQKMQDRSGPYMLEDFATNFLHEIRNSLHGYQLQAGGFEEFLLMHSGEVPDSLPDLALIWYFLALADIQGLISGEWTKGTHPRETAK